MSSLREEIANIILLQISHTHEDNVKFYKETADIIVSKIEKRIDSRLEELKPFPLNDIHIGIRINELENIKEMLK